MKSLHQPIEQLPSKYRTTIVVIRCLAVFFLIWALMLLGGWIWFHLQSPAVPAVDRAPEVAWRTWFRFLGAAASLNLLAVVIEKSERKRTSSR
jgi:hypothetical protein